MAVHNMFGASLLLAAASSPVEECPRDGSQHLRHGECEDFVPPYLCRKNFRHVSSSTDRKCCICGAGSVRCCVLAKNGSHSAGLSMRSMTDTSSNSTSGLDLFASRPQSAPMYYTISTASACVFGDNKYAGAVAVGKKVYLCARAPLSFRNAQ